MKMRNRKLIAIVCAIALVIGSFATYTAKTNASQADAAAYDYSGIGWQADGATGAAGTYANQFKFAPISGNPNPVNIQNKENEPGIYISLGGIPEGTWVLNGQTLTASTDYYTQGASGWILLSALTEMYNDLVIHDSGGTQIAEAYIYNAKGSGGGESSSQAPSESSSAGGYTPVTTQWVTVGNFQIFQGYDGRSMEYQGTGAYNDMKVKMNGTTGVETWSTQIGIDYAGLTAGTTYDYTVVYNSNQAFTMFAQVPGESAVQTVNGISVVNGQNTFSGSFTAGTNPAHGNIMFFPQSAPDGTIFDFTSVTITEHSGPTTTPAVQTINIIPNTTEITNHHNIWASWTNPAGSSKAYVYLEQVDNAHAAATLNNGWIFNDQAGQPMTGVDNVAQTRDASVKIAEGQTYTLIVESFNAQDQKTGHGEVQITIPGLTPEESEAQEYLAKIATSDNLALQKPVTVASNQGTKQNITDGDNNTRWQADKTIDNTSFAVDLREVCTVEEILVSWEGSNATAYSIYTAGDDGVYGGSPVATVSGLTANLAQIKLTKNLSVNARYVKIVVTGWSPNAETYGISPYELAVFGQGGAAGREIAFSKAWRQTLDDGYYTLNANWLAPSGASYYKSYINVEDDDHKAKAANGWVWSDQNGGLGSPDTWVDHVVSTKNDVYVDDDMTYTLIVVAYDSEGTEVARGTTTLDEKPAMTELDYTATNDVLVQGQSSKLPCSYAIYDAESSYDMREEAAHWVNRPHTYSDQFAEITWGDQSRLYNSPDSVAVNGTNYTSTTPPIANYAATLVQVQANAENGFVVGYNKVRIKKGDNFVTVVFRVGGATAPVGVTATEQSGVPGSIRVDWTPGQGTPAGQVYRVYVDGDMKKGNLTGTSAIVNNIEAGTHTVKVVGFYLDEESDGPTDDVTVSTGVKYSSDISIEGFQIRSNYPDDATEQEKNNVAYRTMCKAPKKNSTIKVGGKTYTIRDVGTSYALDTNTRDKDGTNVLDASYTLLNETPVNANNVQYTYTGYRTYQGNNRTYGYVATDTAIISDYKAGDTDNVYYAFTMQNMNQYMANTLWVRPFIVAYDGTIIYGKSTAYTSVAEITNKLYTNSMSKNETSHEYLFDRILHNDVLRTGQNPFYRNSDQKIQYGWNGNLYIGFRKVPDSWNGGQTDEGQYVVVGDWKIHNSSHYNELTGNMAAASYKGNSNDEMMVRVDNPGEERDTDGLFPWNWGIQMKLANIDAYSRLEDGRRYKMTITYNSTKAGIMRIKTEGNNASRVEDGYYTDGHDIVYDFDAVAGGNAHSITFTYDKNKYVNNPGADPSIVLCLGQFKVYPFTTTSTERPHDSRSELCIDYYDVNDKTHERQHQPGDIGGFPAGTIISDVDIQFTEID